MNDAKVMHILQTLRDVNQLNTTSVRFVRGQVITRAYEFSAVDVTVPLDELIDVSVFHPLGDQSEPVFAHCHSKERQDVGMPKVFPSDTLSAESLHPFVQIDMAVQVGNAHPEDNFQVASDINSHNLESNPTPLVHALGHVGEPPAFDFHGALRTVRDVHGLRDYTVSAACFAQLVEQLESFAIRQSTIL